MNTNNMQVLLTDIMTSAISRMGDSLVSLYTYGSVARGDTNEWSDIDVCTIYNSYEAASKYAEWANDLLMKTNYILDPVGLSILDIGENSHWEHAPFLYALITRSDLLYGIDVRSNIIRPTERKLLLAMCDSAARWIRGIYGIPLNLPLIIPLPDLEIGNRQQRCVGNIAWELITTILQILRALIFMENNTYCESKPSIGAAVHTCDDLDMQSAYADSMSIREHIGRFTPLNPVPYEVYALGKQIPILANRFLNNLSVNNLVDPSYQPEGKSLYDTYGMLIT